MKRFILAGLFFVLGLIILGTVTADLMSGPDKPQTPQRSPAANNDTRNRHSPPTLQQQQQMTQQQRQQGGLAPYIQQPKPVQPASTPPLPGMPVPLTTTVQAPTVKPPPQPETPHVPALQQTDESSSRANAGTSK